MARSAITADIAAYTYTGDEVGGVESFVRFTVIWIT